MTEIKQFKLVKDKLHVKVFTENDVFLPSVDGKQEKVGKFEQQTVQIIDSDKIVSLKNFVESERNKAAKQLKQLEEQYEPIKDLKEIDETLLKHMKAAIAKGSKAFKTDMIKLNKMIEDLDKKKGLKMQIDFIKTQLKTINLDLDEIIEIIK